MKSEEVENNDDDDCIMDSLAREVTEKHNKYKRMQSRLSGGSSIKIIKVGED